MRRFPNPALSARYPSFSEMSNANAGIVVALSLISRNLGFIAFSFLSAIYAFEVESRAICFYYPLMAVEETRQGCAKPPLDFGHMESAKGNESAQTDVR